MSVKIIVDGSIRVSTTKVPAVVELLSHYIYSKKGEPYTPVQVDWNNFRFPRNLKKFAFLLKKAGIKVGFVDKRVWSSVAKEIILSDGFKLKDDQERCSNLIKNIHKKKEYSLVLEAPCGWGKTFQLAYYLSLLQQKTLILVDRTILAQQMKIEIEDNSNIEVNMINAKNKKVGDINVTTLQFLMRNPDMVKKLGSSIGSVVLDECHIAPADKFCQIIGALPAVYRLGLSATPTRSDGLTSVITDVFSTNRVIGINDGLSCTIVILARPEVFFFPEIKVYKAYLDAFVTQPSVSTDVEFLMLSLRDKGRVSLLYATSQTVQDFYFERLTSIGVSCVVVNSTTKKRQEIFKDIEAEKYDVVIAGNVLNKGVSIKRLDTCVNLSTLTKEDIEQLVGRLRREHPSKGKPILIDFAFDGALWRKNEVRQSTYYALKSKYKDKVIKRGNFEELKASLQLTRS